MYRDREDAGEKLWSVIRNQLSEDSLILAVPRGGVKVALPICRNSGIGMDIIIPKKLRAPYREEIAIGAIAEDNIYVVNEEAITYLDISEDYIRKEVNHQMVLIKDIRRKYNTRARMDMKDGKVIIVDDGIATGMTLLVAVKYMKLHKAKDVIIAAPVASKEAVYLLESNGAKVIVHEVPDDFTAVGSYYLDFDQVEDHEVIDILRKYNIQ